VAPDGVDLERFIPEKSEAEARRLVGLPQDVFLLCHCGHMYPGRGAEELLEALVSLPNVMLELVGGSPEDIERVRRHAVDLGVEGRVRFMGTVPNGKVPLYLWAADALLMPYTSRVPTQRSMSPLKMFEYMAARRPIVATDFPAIREVLRHRENAILVKPDSPAALKAGIQAVREDPRQAERLAAPARQDVEEYAWERRANKILEVLRG
jgi:glycosyltransferase involved in cell wall biosynthesis